MNWTTLFKKFTNGKYFIGLLAVAFLSIGSFTKAENFTVNCTAWVECTPEMVYTWNTLQDSDTICIPNLQEGMNVRVITEYDEYAIIYYDEMQSNNFCVGRTIKGIGFYPSDVSGEFTFNVIGGGLVDSSSNNNGGNIVEGGTSNFAPIMTQLGNIAGEFIPYMIYIAIGCASVWLAYEAVRTILRYLNKKSNFGNERVYYDRKRHNEDERNGRLKPEREYYKKR